MKTIPTTGGDTPTPGEAAALPTIEAIMGLVEAYADESSRDSRDGACESDETEAARESLRAALARALPVGESELLTVIRDVDRLLTNLQPHIEQACLPGHAGFIDNYVDPALEKLRGALPEWKAVMSQPVGEERDAARLDWIDRSRLTLAVNWNQVRPTSFEFAGFSIEGFSGVYPTCRLAIDSAMAPKGETP